MVSWGSLLALGFFAEVLFVGRLFLALVISGSTPESLSAAFSGSSLFSSGRASASVFFWTLATTALVLPPTVINEIFSPFRSVFGLSFFPFPQRCLNSHVSGNFSGSACVLTARELTSCREL